MIRRTSFRADSVILYACNVGAVRHNETIIYLLLLYELWSRQSTATIYYCKATAVLDASNNALNSCDLHDFDTPVILEIVDVKDAVVAINHTGSNDSQDECRIGVRGWNSSRNRLDVENHDA